jgi:hypothetical protein
MCVRNGRSFRCQSLGRSRNKRDKTQFDCRARSASPVVRSDSGAMPQARKAYNVFSSKAARSEFYSETD